MREWLKKESVKFNLMIIGKTLFYFMVILLLIYLYNYKNVQGGSFIYNEF